MEKIDQSRYFPNPHLDVSSYSAGHETNRSEEHEQDPNKPSTWTTTTYLHNIHQLIRRCQVAFESNPPSSYGSLYCGSLGPIVFLEWKWAKLLREIDSRPRSLVELPYESNQKKVQQALKRAQQASQFYQTRSHGRCRVTLLESPFVGAKALETVLLQTLNRSQEAQQSAQSLVDWLQSATVEEKMPLEDCEVLYGRAGALQAILFLRHELSDPALGSLLVLKLARTILSQGRNTAQMAQTPPCLPLLWHWHNKAYLGAAHGVVGILQTLLMLQTRELQTLESETPGTMSLIQQTIDGLHQYHCFKSGNLDSSIKKHNHKATDGLVQWCHGAVGHVLLLVQASKVFPEQGSKYQKLSRDICMNVIWPRGLLRKGVGLCHGISGNAYALLALASVDQSFLGKTWVFADFAWQHLSSLESIPDRPHSLFEGTGGLCLLLMDLLSVQTGLKDPGSVGFPLYIFS